jgi:hypothetical protein
MSIFKGTINPEIAAQLKARESVVSQADNNTVGLKPRDSNFLQYTSGKNGWTRMTSFVNYNDPKSIYKGDALSKKYVLEGGTQYYNTNTTNFNVREGIGKNNSIYASDLDSGALKSDFRQFGYRPMPGITSVSVVNKGAYGSLRQATVKFYCWDKHQLDELEILFMRVGYTVLLEWGWSQYLDHKVPNETNKIPEGINIKPFTGKPINPFAYNSEEAIYETIDNAISQYRGNYDAMLGYIQNFSWQLLPNGGFECTTVLISRGEAISSIKASSNPYTIIDSDVKKDVYLENTIDGAGNAVENPPLSLFEKIFLNIKANDNQSEITDEKGEFYVQFDTNISGNESIRKANNDLIKQQVATTFSNIQKFMGLQSFKIVGNDGKIFTEKYENNTFHINKWLKPTDGQSDGTAIEYINLDQVVALLNAFFLPKGSNKKNIVDIILPGDTPCLACEDSVSIDPKTCLFRNDQATFIINKTDSNGKSIGFNPEFYTLDTSATNAIWGGETNIDPKFQFLSLKGSSTYVGKIGNIYVSIQKLIDIYRSNISSDGLSILNFLEILLEDISRALGGINDFKLYTQRNTIQIIDAKYLEISSDKDGSSKSKFKFDLVGLKSICRDVKINSRIFSEQASMIAIGAAASGESQNIGDIYSSTQQEFNKNIKDRIISSIIIGSPDNESRSFPDNTPIPPEINYYYDIYNNIQALSGYIDRKVLGTPGNVSTGGKTPWNIIRTPSDNEVANTSTLLNTLLMQLNGKDIDFKAIIPFELELTLDGIGGFIIGQIFTIDKSILPSQYAKSNVGFIITGISNSLQNNDWTTTLKTQICLLDNDKKTSKLSKSVKDKLKIIIAAIRTQVETNSFVANAMADYLVYLTVNLLANKNKGVGLAASQKAGISYDDNLKSIDFANVSTLNNGNMKQTINVINSSLKFYNSAAPTGGYLYQWWKNADKTLKNFPQTFNELITVKLTDGKTTSLDQILSVFENMEVVNRFKAADKGLLPEDIFIYRYFGKSPLSELKSKFKSKESINTETRTGDIVYLVLESLRVNYIEKVTNFINSNETNKDLKGFIIPLAGQDYTIESNPYTSKSKIIWDNNERLKPVR